VVAHCSVSLRRMLLAALALLSGCATVRPHPLPPPAGERRAGPRQTRGAGPAFALADQPNLPADVKTAIATALTLVGRRDIVVDGIDYGDDCAALVRASFARAGRPLPDAARDAQTIELVARVRGALRTGLRPSPGDLIFFSDLPGGAVAHVGLVARMDPDGTAMVLHRTARGVMRVRVNLGYAEQTNDPSTGRRINDLLVASGATEGIPAGRLVTGFSRPL